MKSCFGLDYVGSANGLDRRMDWIGEWTGSANGLDQRMDWIRLSVIWRDCEMVMGCGSVWIGLDSTI